MSRLNFWDMGSTASTLKLQIWTKSIRIQGPWQDLKLPIVRQSWDEGIWEISSLSRYLEVIGGKKKQDAEENPTINADACTQYTKHTSRLEREHIFQKTTGDLRENADGFNRWAASFLTDLHKQAQRQRENTFKKKMVNLRFLTEQ